MAEDGKDSRECLEESGKCKTLKYILWHFRSSDFIKIYCHPIHSIFIIKDDIDFAGTEYTNFRIMYLVTETNDSYSNFQSTIHQILQRKSSFILVRNIMLKSCRISLGLKALMFENVLCSNIDVLFKGNGNENIDLLLLNVSFISPSKYCRNTVHVANIGSLYITAKNSKFQCFRLMAESKYMHVLFKNCIFFKDPKQGYNTLILERNNGWFLLQNFIKFDNVTVQLTSNSKMVSEQHQQSECLITIELENIDLHIINSSFSYLHCAVSVLKRNPRLKYDAVYLSMRVLNCKFQFNHGSLKGSAINIILYQYATPLITADIIVKSCFFNENVASVQGGCINIESGPYESLYDKQVTVFIENSEFIRNVRLA